MKIIIYNDMIICIDGPAGAGKGTVAKEIAKELSIPYLNSGNIYRSLAYEFLQSSQQKQVNFHKALKTIQTSIDYNNIFSDLLFLCKSITLNLLNDLETNNKLNKVEIAQLASILAANASVRNTLIELQRSFIDHQKGLVTDGRDMGTVVFPYAEHKFFLKANLKVRAYRRFLELKTTGASYDYILEEIKKRDIRDVNRIIAPLVPAKDSIVLDCTFLTEKDLKNLMISMIKLKKIHKSS